LLCKRINNTRGTLTIALISHNNSPSLSGKFFTDLFWTNTGMHNAIRYDKMTIYVRPKAGK